MGLAGCDACVHEAQIGTAKVGRPVDLRLHTCANLDESGFGIVQVCAEVRDLLLAKNEKYGDSAINPLRIFSKADPVEQIKVRIDDKLSRLSRGNGIEDEDVILDLLGYLVLLRVAQRREKVRGDT